MSSRWRQVLIALFVLAALVRLPDVWRPVDGSVRDSWREPDVAGIARNFYVEGMNPFRPRIDWRGDGPGFTESELPLQPWLTACLYHVFGYHEELLRVVSFVLSMAACGVFFWMVSERLPRVAGLIAALAFALNPMAVRMASSIQPEPMMFLGYLAAAHFFLRWCERRQRRDYLWAIAATALAILAKIPAAHIGVMFAALCFQHFGWRCVVRRDVWLFVVLSLGLPAAWYAYAHTLWLEYGNSLGMSNEAYVRIASGNFWSVLTVTIPSNVRIESDWIWMSSGLLLGVAGLWPVVRQREYRWIAYWLLSLVAFYVVAGRTTSEDWAKHYHIVSVPVACLLIGLGASLVPEVWSFASQHVEHSWLTRWGRRAVALLLISLTVRTLQLEAGTLRADLHPNACAQLFECAQQFRSHVEPDCLIVASGDGQLDQFGLMRAYNAPYFFFWTRTKGFTLADEDQSLEKLTELRRRGARYFVAEKRSLRKAEGFEQQLRDRFRVLDEHDKALLIDLTEMPEKADEHAHR